MGYKPSRANKGSLQAEKKAKRFARLEGKEWEGERKPIPWLYDCFIYRGIQNKIELPNTGAVSGKLPGDSFIKANGIIFVNLCDQFGEFKVSTVEEKQ